MNNQSQSLICSLLIFKRAIVWLLAHSLFKKERMSNCSFRRSLQKSERAITLILSRDCSFALSKRTKEQKKVKNERFSKLLIFRSKKERLLIFKMSECPTLLFVVGRDIYLWRGVVYIVYSKYDINLLYPDPPSITTRFLWQMALKSVSGKVQLGRGMGQRLP